ncbi:substrate-binding domain-containing protein [Aureimonas sp. AU12]|uniref:LacI family DNA-binding transcriptional regulator n=1 Tax=Aureimonas sp. AU12 TaxID=1638161 RepID=UPI0007866925|nr:substrate-binding domain-containing protein [Aureimonas sp. AU12]
MAQDGKRTGFASAQQVADRAGVSRSAVSRTFTPGASVSSETRRRVLEAAEDLGYHVNHLARGLMSHETGIVCLIVADLHTPYLSRMVERLTRGLQEAGKVAMVLNAAGRLENVEDALRQTLNYRADATVVLSGTPDPAIARTCLDSGQRLVLLNRDDQLAGTVNLAVDSQTSAATAVRCFLEAGCQQLAVVSSGAGTPSLLGRERHFIAAARSEGFEPRVWHEGPTAHASGMAGARALLASKDRPDAVFCVTDLLACGFLDGARHEFGLQVPRELCVIGFDDIEQAGWPSYDLTTFAQPVDDLVRRIVSLVVDRDQADGGPEETLPVPLVWRGSVRGSRLSVAAPAAR